MYRYKIGPKLGSGSYGEVYQAVHKETGQKVAIKTLRDRFDKLEDCLQLPEVIAHKNLQHPNIVRCHEILLHESRANLVFEYMDGGDLEHYCRQHHHRLSEHQLRPIFYQILSALDYIHHEQILHRDIKPENILLNLKTNPPTVKLADFGMAKRVFPHTLRPYSSYVATRWYRAPELLLQAPKYGPAVDMWAAGTVFAEIFLGGTPLFPGKDEADQMESIVRKRGHPRMAGWRQGADLLKARGFHVPLVTPTSIDELVPDASHSFKQLLEDLLKYDPDERPLAAEAMRYPFFTTTPLQLPSSLKNDPVSQEYHDDNQYHRQSGKPRRPEPLPHSHESPEHRSGLCRRPALLDSSREKVPEISLVSEDTDLSIRRDTLDYLHDEVRYARRPSESWSRTKDVSRRMKCLPLRRSQRLRTQPDRYIPGEQMFVIPKIKVANRGITKLRSPAASFNMRKRQ